MKCHRTACDSNNALVYNVATRAFYCPRCARAIEDYSPGITVRLDPKLVAQAEENLRRLISPEGACPTSGGGEQLLQKLDAADGHVDAPGYEAVDPDSGG